MVDWARQKSLAARVGFLGLPWVLSAAAFSPQQPVAPVDLASPAPIVQADEPEVVIRWLLRSEDLGSCVTAAPNVRRLLVEYGSRVRIEAVGVGADTAVVRSYMRGERLFRVTVGEMSRSDYRRELAAAFPGQAIEGPVLRYIIPNRSLARFASSTNSSPRAFRASRQGSADLLAHLRVLLGSGPGRSRIVTAEGGQR